MAFSESKLKRIRLEEGDRFQADQNNIIEAYETLDKQSLSTGIRILSFLGGIAVALLYFSWPLLDLDSPIALLILGLVSLVGSTYLDRLQNEPILDTFVFSVYCFGLFLVASSLAVFQIDLHLVALIIGLLSFISLFIIRRKLMAFGATASILIASFYLIVSPISPIRLQLFLTLITFIVSYIYLNEATLIQGYRIWNRFYNPIRYATLLSMCIGLILTTTYFFDINTPSHYNWISSVAALSVLYYLLPTARKHLYPSPLYLSILGYALILAFSSMITLYVPSIQGAILILVLSFKINDKTGLVLGIITLLFSICKYYYDLDFSLLTKSIVLMLSGITLTILHLWIKKNVPPQ